MPRCYRYVDLRARNVMFLFISCSFQLQDCETHFISQAILKHLHEAGHVTIRLIQEPDVNLPPFPLEFEPPWLEAERHT